MMTVAASLKQQRRNFVDYITQACEAALRGEVAPALLPVQTPRKKRLQAA